MAITQIRPSFYENDRVNEWCALSTDTWPTASTEGYRILNGDKLLIIDTGAQYIYNSDTNTWMPQPGKWGEGRFLSIWNCPTGLPLTNPPTLPYAYKTGDYYRVGAVANGSYNHAITLAGTASQYGIHEGTYSVSFTISNSVATQYTTIAAIAAALGEDGVTATGVLHTTDVGDLDIIAVIEWEQEGNLVVALLDDTRQKVALTMTTADTLTDTVTGCTTNYKPNGTSYTGAASTTVETDTDIAVGWVYYYDGTTWRATGSGAGGEVMDVQINGTSIVNATSGVANVTDDLLEDVKYTSQTLTAAQKSQARTNIGAVTNSATGSYSVTIEGNATTRNCATNMGANSTAGAYKTSAYGCDAEATAENASAFGYNAEASAAGAVQLGEGTNSTANTLQFKGNTVVDANGKVPNARLNLDASVTSGSTNPVTGGAVYTELSGKQDTLTFDTTPTSSSTNPVTSGGIKTALDDKQDKNLGTALAGQYVYVGSTGELSTVSVSPAYQNDDPYAVHYTADTPSTTEQGIARDNIDVYSTGEMDTALGNKVDKTTFEALGLSVVDGALNITYTEE